MKVRLEVSHKSGKKRTVSIHSDAVIGRSTECSLRIASSEISRKHCKLTVIESGVLVRDLESANGTWVNGKMIPPSRDVALPPGSRLSIGPVQFLVQYESSNPAIDPPGSTVELPAVQAFADAATPPTPAAAAADEAVPDEVEIEQSDANDAMEDDSEGVATVVVQPEEAQQAIADALAGRVADIEAESAADVVDVEDAVDVEEVEDAEVDEAEAVEDVEVAVDAEPEETTPAPTLQPAKGKLGSMFGGLLKFRRKPKTEIAADSPTPPAAPVAEEAEEVAAAEETTTAASEEIAPPIEPAAEPDVEYEDEGEEGYYEDDEEFEEEYEDEEEVDSELGDFFNQFEDK